MDVGYECTFGPNLMEVRGLNVSYPNAQGIEVPVLRNLEISIPKIIRPGHSQGQVEAWLAPSGMGKTQLFRSIAGLQKPNSGTLSISQDGDGGNVTAVHVGLIGVVAQDYPLFNHLTVMDNLMKAAMIRQKDRKAAKAIVLEYLSQFLLSDKANHYPHQLSGGQRQRVAIIQQMICNNTILLMDEPFSGLDILMKEEVQHVIAKVSENDKRTVVFTTHDIQSAIASADTILLLGRERDKDGKPIPGAFIKYKYDLIQAGLAWHPNVSELPAFAVLEREIKARFKEL